MTHDTAAAGPAGDGDQPVIAETRGAIAHIIFNRPDRLNALDLATALGFRSAVAAAVDDRDVRVIVIRAEGRAFVAGGDLVYLHEAQDKPAAAHELIEPMHGALLALAQAPQLVVGSLKGAVAGGGMSLALGGLDLAIAADDTVFNMAYAAIGASPDCGGTWALPRLVGLRRALAMTLLCESVDAGQALALGLVNKVVAREALDAETDALAARLARIAPAAAAHTKALLRASLEHGYAEQLDRERDSFAACAATADFAGLVSAFLSRRGSASRG